MGEKEIIRLIQNYRHDLMNRLQIVSGYLSMGKADKAKESLENVLAFYEEERKLMRLNADKFLIWILQFQDVYPSFTLTYRVDLMELSSNSIDDQKLLSTSKRLLAFLLEETEDLQVYELFLHIEEKAGHWALRMNIKDAIFETIKIKNIETQCDVSITQEEDQTNIEWIIAK
ncbi:Spo0B domain-containing protein [Oceanobacillus sp. J11TS1]|uniref:Spo0B domain-containing protein n=1 Tax=Oceanobacillus sp. J11TS1 TaxID=2807191 RepID=UPI001B199F26|nr:Spo0B domain-containing protein [Oceanobacillus sp. J11TS1]GIO21796.1 hypothetical protein J11TS1_03770 [Oceanobacillus sp. J11TS1]